MSSVRRPHGRLFQIRGPAAPKLLSRKLLCVCGTAHVLSEEDWRDRRLPSLVHSYAKLPKDAYIPTARPARNAAPRLVMSRLSGRSKVQFVRLEMSWIRKLLLHTPPSHLTFNKQTLVIKRTNSFCDPALIFWQTYYFLAKYWQDVLDSFKCIYQMVTTSMVQEVWAESCTIVFVSGTSYSLVQTLLP